MLYLHCYIYIACNVLGQSTVLYSSGWVHCSGLHKLHTHLWLCMYGACKLHYAYTNIICVQYWFLCVKVIWVCQCVCLFFSSLCLVAFFCYHVVMLAPSWCWFFFFFHFYGSRLCGPGMNQISLSQYKGWFSFILKHFWPIRELIWLYKQSLRMILSCITILLYYCVTWMVTIVNCFCPLVLTTCHNWELLIAHPHKPLCFHKITTLITSFLISNTVFPNPYSHSTVFDPHSFAPLS